MSSYDQTRRGLEMVLAECRRENTLLREEQSRLNNQLRNLYASNQRLIQENQTLLDETQELSDLCLYLDDERIRLSKIVEDWEKFGKYYCEKFSSDMSLCQEKMKMLEELENTILKGKQTNERLTSPIGISENLRRGGDGSSSPSPSMEIYPKDQNAPSVLQMPFSDSDDSLNRGISDSKSHSFFYQKPNRSDLSNVSGKSWNRSFQDVTRDTSRYAARDKNEAPTKSQRSPHVAVDSLSLSRPETGNRWNAPSTTTQVVFSHPFQKVHSYSSINGLDGQIQRSSSRNAIPEFGPSRQMSHSRNLNFRSSSAVPPDFHAPSMFGYHLVNDNSRQEGMPNRTVAEKEPSRRFTKYPEEFGNNNSYKTSF